MTDGDQMGVAIFCLEQMWQATAIGEQEGAAETLPSWEDGEWWERAERYVLKLDHVNKACRILEQRGWPEPFPQSARNAAKAFVGVWQEKKGKDLRDAYAHYEEALSDPNHRLRGEPAGYDTVQGVAGRPYWWTGNSWKVGQGPDSIDLLGKEYDLRGVHETLVTLRQEFGKVLDWWNERSGE